MIENKISGKKYIGKKLTSKSKTKMVNKKKKKFKVESDWKNYYGSSEDLLKDVKEFGKESFKRTIIRLCKTKAGSSYWEIFHQMTEHALLSDNYYNKFVGCRIRREHLKNEDLT